MCQLPFHLVGGWFRPTKLSAGLMQLNLNRWQSERLPQTRCKVVLFNK